MTDLAGLIRQAREANDMEAIARCIHDSPPRALCVLALELLDTSAKRRPDVSERKRRAMALIAASCLDFAARKIRRLVAEREVALDAGER